MAERQVLLQACITTPFILNNKSSINSLILAIFSEIKALFGSQAQNHMKNSLKTAGAACLAVGLVST